MKGADSAVLPRQRTDIAQSSDQKGDQRFHRKCHAALFEERAGRAMILASHAMDIVREYCTHALVLKDGRGKVFTNIETAIAIYSAL